MAETVELPAAEPKEEDQNVPLMDPTGPVPQTAPEEEEEKQVEAAMVSPGKLPKAVERLQQPGNGSGGPEPPAEQDDTKGKHDKKEKEKKKDKEKKEKADKKEKKEKEKDGQLPKPTKSEIKRKQPTPDPNQSKLRFGKSHRK